MAKSEEVVDLLSHLPYIDDADWEWSYETKPINYIGPLNLKRLNGDFESKCYLFEPSELRFPPHVFSLTNGRLYRRWYFLDLQSGTTTDFSVLGGKTYQVTEEQATSGTVWQFHPPSGLTSSLQHVKVTGEANFCLRCEFW